MDNLERSLMQYYNVYIFAATEDPKFSFLQLLVFAQEICMSSW